MTVIEDRLAVGDVIIKYADSVDLLDYDRYASCFTDDVVVTGFTTEPIVGLPTYMAWLRPARDRFGRTQHLIGNIQVTVDGDTAHMRSYVQATHEVPGDSRPPADALGRLRRRPRAHRRRLEDQPPPHRTPHRRQAHRHHEAMTDQDAMFAAITAQRLRLVDTLDGLSDHEWSTPSLCEGWRVREVAGHLVSILEVPLGRVVWSIVRSGGFDRSMDRTARRFGERDPKALASAYRALAPKRFAPPGLGTIAPLSDITIHTRDIERPIGRPSTIDPATLRTVLDFLCGGRARGFVPAARTKGLRFEATDLDWSAGAGPVVSGTGEAIMLAVAGRRVAVPDLSGAGVAALSQRLA